jgi:hypothetical protein
VDGYDKSDYHCRQQIGKRQPLIAQSIQQACIPYGFYDVVGSDNQKQIEKKKEGNFEFAWLDFDYSGKDSMNPAFCHIPTLSNKSHELA